jgi:hypothetical protein
MNTIDVLAEHWLAACGASLAIEALSEAPKHWWAFDQGMLAVRRNLPNWGFSASGACGRRARRLSRQLLGPRFLRKGQPRLRPRLLLVHVSGRLLIEVS